MPETTSEIIEAAQGLGLRVALEAEPDTPPSVLASSDLTLFATASDRDAALAEALRTLPRTVTLRDRFRVGTGSDVLGAIRESGRPLSTAGATNGRHASTTGSASLRNSHSTPASSA